MKDKDFETLEVLNELLDAFEQKYQPASSIQESDEQLTSPEILNLFNSATKVTYDQLYQALKQRGFKTEIVNNSFMWMLSCK